MKLLNVELNESIIMVLLSIGIYYHLLLLPSNNCALVYLQTICASPHEVDGRQIRHTQPLQALDISPVTLNMLPVLVVT